MSEEDTKVADLFDKDIENFGNDLDKMIEHLNIVIATHNKQVEEIERLNDKEEQLIRRLEDLIVVGEQVENEWAVDICKMIIKELKGSDKE